MREPDMPICPVCKEALVRTSNAYCCCPKGHGKLVSNPNGKSTEPPTYGNVPALVKAWAKVQDAERGKPLAQIPAKRAVKPIPASQDAPGSTISPPAGPEVAPEREAILRRLAALKSTKGEYAAATRARLEQQLQLTGG